MKVWAQAFTHETYSREPEANYENLEYRGDTLLGYIFPKYLMQKFPNLAPRVYTELHVSYMSKKPFTYGSQTNTAERLGFGEYVRMAGLSTPTSGVLTDLFESFFGALDVIADRKGFGLGGVYGYNMIVNLFSDVDIDVDTAIGAPKTQVEQLFIRLGLRKPREERRMEINGDETVTISLYPNQAIFLADFSDNIRDFIRTHPPETEPIVLGSASSPSRKMAEHQAFEQSLESLRLQGVTHDWVRKIKYQEDFYKNDLLRPYMDAVNRRLESEGYEPEIFFFLPKKMVEKTETGERRVIQLIGTRRQGLQRAGREDILATVISSDKSNSYQIAKALLLAHYSRSPPPSQAPLTSQVIGTRF